MHSPEWGSSVLFITWDDCGCFYDQAKPEVNPDGTQQGPRLLMVIVSPYVKPKYTDSRATTFAGVLAYVERLSACLRWGPMTRAHMATATRSTTPRSRFRPFPW